MHAGNSFPKVSAKTITSVAIVLFLSFVFSTAARAQSNVYTKWSATYVANPSGIPIATAADGLGNVYVTGSIASESVTVKYDSKGNTLWRAFLSAAPAADPYSATDPGSAQGTGLSVALDELGNVYVLSVLLIPNNPSAGPPIIATAKYSSLGVRQWVNYIASTYSVEQALTPNLIPINNYFPTSMAVSPTGNVYVSYFTTGPKIDSGDGSLASLVKYDTTGKQQWTETAPATPFGNNAPEGVQLDGSENVYMLVFSFDPTNSPMNASEIFKFSSAGSLLASFGSDKLGFLMPAAASTTLISTYRAPIAFPFHVDAQGNSYVAGGGSTTSPGSGQIYGIEPRVVAKFNSSGALDWLYTFVPPNDQAGSTVGITGLAVDLAGNVLVAQTTDLKGANPPGAQGTDISVNKFDPNGNLPWTANYNGHSDGSGFDEATAIAVDSAGSSYVTGLSTGTVQSPVGVENVLATIKYDSVGNQVWAERYQPNTEITYGPPTALAVSGSDVFLTGLGGVIVPPSQSPSQEWLTINYGQDAFEVSPALVTFANQTVGTQSASQTVTLTNVTSSPYILKTMNFTGPFHLTENCPDLILPGESCSIVVTFTPTTTSVAPGTITIRDTSPGNAVSPETIHLTGTGTN